MSNSPKSVQNVVIPADAVAVDAGSIDVDLTILWSDQKFARGLRNGAAAAADINVVTFASSTTVLYKNVPSGGSIYGMFRTLKHSSTTATNVVAEK